MNRQESATLNITRFVMSIFIVLLHSYTTVQMYSFLNEHMLYQKVARVFSFQCGELGVPTFFLISGYLFFCGYKQTWENYRYKLSKRVYSLFIPYLFWNFLMLMMMYCAESIPMVLNLFNDGKKLVHEYTFTDLLRAFWSMDNGYPILTQLWFVRNLILLVIGAPVIYFYVKYARMAGVLIWGILWMISPGQAYPMSTLFYYCLGAWFSINGRSITELLEKRMLPIVLIYPAVMVADALLIHSPVAFYAHRFQTFCGVFFMITAVSWLVRKGKIKDIVYLGSFSFFLYVAHDPLLRFIRKFSLKLTNNNSEFQMIAAYFGAVVLDIAIVYALYWLLHKYAPRILKWTVGR